MKKLYAFIQTLLNLLSKAYKKINHLNSICKELQDAMDENWNLAEKWATKWQIDTERLHEENARLKNQISEWKISHDHWQHEYCEKAEALTRAINIIKDLTGMEENPYTEEWTEETNLRYVPFDDGEDYDSDEDYAEWILQKNWAELDDSIWQYADIDIAHGQEQIMAEMKLWDYDDGYRFWVETELGISPTWCDYSPWEVWTE